MSTINEPRPCPTCGKSIPSDAPMGVCPHCLLALTAETEPAAAKAAFVPPTPEELAPKFPNLEILELIGRGGMGAVFKARQTDLDRIVALKILPPGIGADPEFADRFATEARALAKLNHPNIVTIHEFGSVDGLYFFLMEYVDGVNLRQAIAAGKFQPEEAIAIVPPICDALQFAHENGVVHRDIKPENLLLDRKGDVKIADFGVAKVLGREQDTAAAGTPQYMAPEQSANPDVVDHRADIFAMGVVLYEMLTGETPKGAFAPPSKRVNVDVRVDEIVLRALDAQPEMRYWSAREFQTQIETLVESPAAPAAAEPLPMPNWMRVRSWWIPVLIIYTLNTAITFLLYADKNGDFSSEYGLITLFTILLSMGGFSFLHYLCWNALPEPYRATSPGAAVGYLFIPFYQFYWAFVTFPKLAEGFARLGMDTNDKRILDVRGLGVLYAVWFILWFVMLVVTAFTPWFNVIFLPLDLILFIAFYQAIVRNAVRVQEGDDHHEPRFPVFWSACCFLAIGLLFAAFLNLSSPIVERLEFGGETVPKGYVLMSALILLAIVGTPIIYTTRHVIEKRPRFVRWVTTLLVIVVSLAALRLAPMALYELQKDTQIGDYVELKSDGERYEVSACTLHYHPFLGSDWFELRIILRDHASRYGYDARNIHLDTEDLVRGVPLTPEKLDFNEHGQILWDDKYETVRVTLRGKQILEYDLVQLESDEDGASKAAIASRAENYIRELANGRFDLAIHRSERLPIDPKKTRELQTWWENLASALPQLTKVETKSVSQNSDFITAYLDCEFGENSVALEVKFNSVTQIVSCKRTPSENEVPTSF